MYVCMQKAGIAIQMSCLHPCIFEFIYCFICAVGRPTFTAPIPRASVLTRSYTVSSIIYFEFSWQVILYFAFPKTVAMQLGYTVVA